MAKSDMSGVIGGGSAERRMIGIQQAYARRGIEP